MSTELIPKTTTFRQTDKIRFDNGMPGVSYYYEFGEGDITDPTTDSKIGDFNARDIVFDGEEFISEHGKKYTLSVIAYKAGAKSNVKTIDLSYDGLVTIKDLKANDGNDFQPKTGNEPLTEIDTNEFTGTVDWKTVAGKDVSKFNDTDGYIATISLTTKPGYTFEGVDDNFFKVSGAITTTVPGQGKVVAKFAEPVKVTDLTIKGITAPANNGVPALPSDVTSDEDQWYALAIDWKSNKPTWDKTKFLTGEIYTAKITLKTNTGYTFTGVAANAFTVAGVTGTNTVNSGEITVVFTITP